jgi:phosphoglycolate phosphatase-like HAD superfamily hydrolase
LGFATKTASWPRFAGWRVSKLARRRATALCETECVPSPLPALIFDLDGTLTDSKPGIVACLRQVIAAHNLGDQGPLERFIGPPVEEWTQQLLPHGSHQSRIELAREYRACYDREGWSNNALFPGVDAMLAQLQGEGFALYVCTSKHQHFALRILDLFGLSARFSAVSATTRLTCWPACLGIRTSIRPRAG